MFCIQAFVPPRKGRCFLARSIWRLDSGGAGFTHDCYFCTAKQSFLETGSLSDLLLDLEQPGSAVLTQVKGAVTEDLTDRTAAVRGYMERALAPAVNVLELVCDYTKDSKGRWWLLQVKSFRLDKSKRDKANTILRGVDLLKAKGMGQVRSKTLSWNLRPHVLPLKRFRICVLDWTGGRGRLHHPGAAGARVGQGQGKHCSPHRPPAAPPARRTACSAGAACSLGQGTGRRWC